MIVQPLTKDIPTPSKASNSTSLLSAIQFKEERKESDVVYLGALIVREEIRNVRLLSY